MDAMVPEKVCIPRAVFRSRTQPLAVQLRLDIELHVHYVLIHVADGVGAAVLEAVDALGDAAGALRHTLAGGEEHAHAGDGAGRGVEVGDELTPGCIFAQQAALGL